MHFAARTLDGFSAQNVGSENVTIIAVIAKELLLCKMAPRLGK